MSKITIQDAIDRYLDSVRMARAHNTAMTYKKAMLAFVACLNAEGIAAEAPLEQLGEEAVAHFAAFSKDKSAATERLRLQAAAGFYEFLVAERLAEPNLPRVRMLIRQRGRRPGPRLPQFPRQDIERMLEYADGLDQHPAADELERLRNQRDKALILTLGETGLRIHEACNLRRGDMQLQENKAIVIGKGNREAIVRFSTRAMRAIRSYLQARGSLDGASGRQLGSLPVFARHDKGAGSKQVKAITPSTGRNIIAQHVAAALGPEAAGTITPHSFRHYFVTTVLRGTGNLKMAQELARHKNIQVTQRYAHLSDDELDRGFYEVFETE
ncbi:MAG: tyrosine-type recombinase/integrase [Anaerolineales bacterium]|jgi:site-specific recombinase XerD|nr:tyrosine-type recombinase/integrase [Anaerolineales bacterium]